MANFFIDRPVFAWVLSILIMLAGVLAITQLPVSQYPEVAPPSVEIRVNYPGASAETLETSVMQIIEQNMTGIDGLIYMASTSDSYGVGELTLTFEAGTDPDIAQVQVQNKLQAAMPLLPPQVIEQGIRVNKGGLGFLMVLGFVSADGQMDKYDIADYVGSNIQEPLSRISGVGRIQIFGAQYAMRVWLDPEKMAHYAVSTDDVIAAIRAQNAQIAAGELGGTPALADQAFSASIIVQTRLETPQQFAQIILRTEPMGGTLTLGDVAQIEIGGENYQYESEYNNQPATGLAITLAAGANALETANAIRARMDHLSAYFPQDLTLVYPYDTTPFVRISILNVVQTLIEAVVLVFLVMYLFLQNLRATLIPTLAVPVVLLGTFAILYATGFSINVLTMFAMVLAIGLLVDDAIVVVENVERVMHEDQLPPREATRKSMSQITGALVGIALVIAAVFIPMAFFGGSTGVIYRQFSITIVSAMALSVLVAVTLSPALCASLLKPSDGGLTQRGLFGWFNRGFDHLSRGYQSSVRYILKRVARFLILYAVLLGVLVILFMRLPSAFLPNEDQGILFTQMTLPVNATKARSMEVMDRIEKIFLETEADQVESVFSVIGFSFAGRGQNNGIAFVNLKDWSERKQASQHVEAIAGRAMGQFMQFNDAFVFPFVPPPIITLGVASGFNLQLMDIGNQGHAALMDARNQLLFMAAQDPRLANVRPNGQEDTPQFKIDIDPQKAASFGVSIAEINRTINAVWGSLYIDDFMDQQRVKRVYIQGDAAYRMMPEDLDHWFVRNAEGEMVPMSAIAQGRWIMGSPRLERYNGVSSRNIQGQGAPGVSSGQAMAILEEYLAELPPGFGFEWTGVSLQEQQSGAQAPLLYAISILVVFLCLAALYESWSVPFSVMFVVPLGIIGAVGLAIGQHLSNDVFFQVGLLTTMGLAARNAILIVEFAKTLFEQGMDLRDATLEAVRMRLRPIAMTALTFMLGVTPLMLSTGAGSASQNAIGSAVFGGMVSSTLLAIFFVPLFFVLVFARSARHRQAQKVDKTHAI